MSLESVRSLSAKAREHTEAAKRLEAERDAAIRAALADGVRVAELAEAAGVSIARIYQVRDRRR